MKRLMLLIELFFCSAMLHQRLLVAQEQSEDSTASSSITEEQAHQFEQLIRPLLVDQCYECHSGQSESIEAGLRLDGRELLLRGGESGPAAVSGNPGASLMIAAVRYDSLAMPPTHKLSDRQIAALEQWVADGLPWPDAPAIDSEGSSQQAIDWERVREEHWAWRSVVRYEPPEVQRLDWVKNEVDRFVLAKLESQGLAPSEPAEPHVLLRRMHLDLLGTPPTPAQTTAFIAAYQLDADQAVAEVVDQLLADSAYGQRWGRYWLDVARYSDGFGGFNDSAGLPHAWRYRDWVIQALNDDMPYDQFVKLQIAGDLLIGVEGKVATGFLAVGPTYQSDGGDPDSVAQVHAETLNDRVDTVTRALLGVTVACARCHDHKFDPIPQSDYYALAGIFNNTSAQEAGLADPEVVRAFDDHQKQLAEARQTQKALKDKIATEAREATDEEAETLLQLASRLTELEANTPPAYDRGHVLVETGSGDMHLALRGNPRREGPLVARGFLTLFPEVGWPQAITDSGRVALAHALVERSNPLTSRVIVNRIWSHHFGAGIVRTPSNFGTLGQKPTHPELLDWLASEFMEQGWSLKHLHRIMMTSATYRQSSHFDETKFAIDGDNQWWWRQNPRRLDVEAWRDSLLAVTGELDLALDGPPIDDITISNRRTVYARVSRAGDRFQSDRFLRTFDFPLMSASVESRPTSIVPQQFLFLLNSPFAMQRAQALRRRLHDQAADDISRIQLAYQLLFGRPPSEQELAIGLAYLQVTEPAADPDGADPAIDQSESKPMVETVRNDQLIADFEGETYGDWLVEGEAFGPGPAAGTLPGQMVVSGFQGTGLVNSFFHGDGSTGTLQSPPFKIERRYLKFLIGGGASLDATCMELWVDGQVVRRAAGPNDRPGGSEELKWHAWDVQAWEGREAHLRIIDSATGGWGHINVDHVLASDSDQPPVGPVKPVQDLASVRMKLWEQYAQALLSSNEFMYLR